MGSSDSDTDGDGDRGPEADAGSRADTGPGADAEAAAAGARGRSRTAAIGAVLAAVLIGSSLLFRSATPLDPTVLAAAIGVLALLAGVLLWRRTGTAETDGTAGSDGDSDVWNAIPPWQYDGRHVESGGLTRSEQESALRDIQRQADELEERERN